MPKDFARVLWLFCTLLWVTPCAALTDYDGDGKSDMAFIRRGWWSTVPVLFSNGDGSWRATNFALPSDASWANQPGVIAIPGNYSADGRTGIAFIRPGSDWSTVPVLFSNGDGSWRATNFALPSDASWANQQGVVAIPGNYSADGRTGIASIRPGSDWSTVPVLFSNGDGSWRATNFALPSDASWANQPGVIAIPGNYSADGRTGIAFIRPGSDWSTVPVLFSNGDGSWRATNFALPSDASWANQPGVIAIPGNYSADGRTGIAFIRPGSDWSTVPVLFSNGEGSWRATNFALPSDASWANQPGVIAIPGNYSADGRTGIAFIRPGSDWSTVPVLFSNGDGSWRATNFALPSDASWANQPGVIAIPGNYSADGRTGIAFIRPGSDWSTVPVLFSNGDGSWRATNFALPSDASWANQQGVVAIPGNYSADGRTGIASIRPGSDWSTVPGRSTSGDGG